MNILLNLSLKLLKQTIYKLLKDLVDKFLVTLKKIVLSVTLLLIS